MNGRQREVDDRTLRRLASDPGEWLSCDECFRLLDIYVDAAVGDEQRGNFGPMANHLETCPACLDEARTLVQLAAADSGVDEREVLARLGITRV
jgi:hypothetical protein